MNASHPTPDAQAIIDLSDRLHTPQIIPLPVSTGATDPYYDAAEVVLAPKGYELHLLKPLADSYRTRPERITDTVLITDPDSLIEYLTNYQIPGVTRIFLDTSNSSRPQIDAIIDYHGPSTAETTATPSHCKHVVRYPYPISEPFAAWVKATEKSLDKMFSQEDFSYFLEDRGTDIENPPSDWSLLPAAALQEILEILNLADDRAPMDATSIAAPTATDGDEDDEPSIPQTALQKLRRLRFASAYKLERLAIGIQVASSQKAQQSFNPKSGEREIRFSDEHTTADSSGRTIKVPEIFLISIPVFEDGPRQLIPVRLFYRKSGDRILWGVQMIEPLRMLRRAALTIARHVAEVTTCPLTLGRAKV